jgi:hypothetical protein
MLFVIKENIKYGKKKKTVFFFLQISKFVDSPTERAYIL